MEKGQIYEVVIEDMSSEGQGIGRVFEAGAGEDAGDGMVVFVKNTLVGDHAKIELTKVKKRYAFGRVVEMIEYSPARNEEFDCPHMDEGCGGCPYGRLDYNTQLMVKANQVSEKLIRLSGAEDAVINEIIGMDDDDNEGMGPFRYRNKAVFPVSTGGIITRKGGVVENLGDPAVGFYQAKSHEVVNCNDCYLQSMAAMAAADALRRFMEEDNITAFDPKWNKGLMRSMIVKTAFATGEVMVVLVINGKGIPNVEKLVDMLDDAIYEVGYSLESVVLNINKVNAKVAAKNAEKNKNKDRSEIALEGPIMGDENITVAGKSVIIDELVVGDNERVLQFEISPHSFYQVNPVQMKRLYDKVREYCQVEIEGTGAASTDTDDTKKPVILDLYCGVGSIGLYCADIAEKILGIEVVKAAVLDANRNAVINGIVNAQYICGKAEELLAGAVEEADIAILDPPRAGCMPELLEAVANIGVSRIVYVSCDPATLGRDIKLLREMGYELVEATPVDMFPHTTHVECIVLMSRK